MCNTEISKALLFFFFHGCSAGKLKWFLFASHGAALEGGEEGAFTNEVQWDANFGNTRGSESPAMCFCFKKKSKLRTRQCSTLPEEVMVFSQETAKRNTLRWGSQVAWCFSHRRNERWPLTGMARSFFSPYIEGIDHRGRRTMSGTRRNEQLLQEALS